MLIDESVEKFKALPQEHKDEVIHAHIKAELGGDKEYDDMVAANKKHGLGQSREVNRHILKNHVEKHPDVIKHNQDIADAVNKASSKKAGVKRWAATALAKRAANEYPGKLSDNR